MSTQKKEPDKFHVSGKKKSSQKDIYSSFSEAFDFSDAADGAQSVEYLIQKNRELLNQNIELNQIIKKNRIKEAVLKTQSLVLENMAEGVNAWNDKGTILFANMAFDSMFGYNKGELIGEHVSDITAYSPEENIRLLNEINEFLNEQRTWFGKLKNRKKDGTIFYTEAKISALEIRGKRCLISVHHDLTRRMGMEDTLRESELKYRIVADNTYDWEFWISPEKKFLYISPSCKRITGYDMDEFIEDPNLLYSIIHPADQPLFATHRAEAEKKIFSDEIEFRIVCKDGTIRWIGHTCQPVFDTGGRFIGTRASNRNITRRKMACETLQQHKEFLEKILELIPVGVWIIDSSGQITHGNAVGQKIWGGIRKVGIEDYRQYKGWWLKSGEMIKPDEWAAARAIKNGEISLNEEIEIESFDGKRKIILNFAVPIYSGQNEIIGAVVVNHDITDRKRAEEELKHLSNELVNSNADLQQFAHVAAHDLQAPLLAIEGFLNLLKKRYRDKMDTKADEYIEHIINSTLNMKILIKDILAYSQVGLTGKYFKETDSSLALNMALSNLSISIQKTSAKITHDPLPVVIADESHLTRVFQNLISNAIKYRREVTPKIHISAERKDNEWLFSVSDNGIGIESKDLERIFIAFKRLHGKGKYPGTGIGLSICQKITERFGGRIWVESETGKGSTFFFTIPVKEA